jgi:hypothetical protein
VFRRAGVRVVLKRAHPIRILARHPSVPVSGLLVDYCESLVWIAIYFKV